jgi:CRISPR/Cas system-associated protein Csm6
MSEAEKQDIIRLLQDTRSYLEPTAARQTAETRQKYDDMMLGASQTQHPELRADLIRAAAPLLEYIKEHQAPLDSLDKALLYARQTDATDLVREVVRAIAEEGGFLKLKIF